MRSTIELPEVARCPTCDTTASDSPGPSTAAASAPAALAELSISASIVSRTAETSSASSSGDMTEVLLKLPIRRSAITARQPPSASSPGSGSLIGRPCPAAPLTRAAPSSTAAGHLHGDVCARRWRVGGGSAPLVLPICWGKEPTVRAQNLKNMLLVLVGVASDALAEAEGDLVRWREGAIVLEREGHGWFHAELRTEGDRTIASVRAPDARLEAADVVLESFCAMQADAFVATHAIGDHGTPGGEHARAQAAVQRAEAEAAAARRRLGVAGAPDCAGMSPCG